MICFGNLVVISDHDEIAFSTEEGNSVILRQIVSRPLACHGDSVFTDVLESELKDIFVSDF